MESGSNKESGKMFVSWKLGMLSEGFDIMWKPLWNIIQSLMSNGNYTNCSKRSPCTHPPIRINFGGGPVDKISL